MVTKTNFQLRIFDMEQLKKWDSSENCAICRNSEIKKYFPKKYIWGNTRNVKNPDKSDYNERHSCAHQYVYESPFLNNENIVIENATGSRKYKQQKEIYEQQKPQKNQKHGESNFNDINSPKKTGTKSKKRRPTLCTTFPLSSENNFETISSSKSKRHSSKNSKKEYDECSISTSKSSISKTHKNSKKKYRNMGQVSDKSDLDYKSSTKYKYSNINDGTKQGSLHKSSKKSTNDTTNKTRNAKSSKPVLCDDSKSNKVKKKCHCKSACKSTCKSSCKSTLEPEKSDSELSIKTFRKFLNSLHTYMNSKTTSKKHGTKPEDTDSSCSVCYLRSSLNANRISIDKEDETVKNYYWCDDTLAEDDTTENNSSIKPYI